MTPTGGLSDGPAASNGRGRLLTGPRLAAAGLTAVFAWSYWPTIRSLTEFWDRNPDYSGGMFVPLILGYVLWCERKELAQLPVRVCWWGLGLILLAQGVRLYGLYDMYGSLERYSLVLTVAGMLLFIAGLRAAWKVKWVLAFLLLMVPLPGRVHNAVAVPMQTFASKSAVFGLESMGYLVGRDGNVLRLSDKTQVAVAEACSGLRMLTAFIIVAGVLAFVVRRPAWQKAVVLASSLPVAVAANTVRLIITVVLFEHVGSKTAERFFHDFAGACMMPFAVLVLVAELQLLNYASGGPKGATGATATRSNVSLPSRRREAAACPK